MKLRGNSRRPQGLPGQIFVQAPSGMGTSTQLSLYQDITGVRSMRVGNLSVCNPFNNPNTIFSSNTNGNINLAPNGTGAVTSSANMQILGGDSLVLQSTDGTKSVSLNASTATSTYSIQLPIVPPTVSETGIVLMATYDGTTVTTGWGSGADIVTGTISASVIFNGTSGVLNPINNSSGVSLVTRNSVGNYTINFLSSLGMNYGYMGVLSSPGFITFNAVSGTQLVVTTYATDGVTLTDFNPINVWVISYG